MIKAKHPLPKNAKEMFAEAWPKDRLQNLGGNQMNLLMGIGMAADHVLTVPSLRQMLKDVEQDHQEELIPFSPHIQWLVELGSKRGGLQSSSSQEKKPDSQKPSENSGRRRVTREQAKAQFVAGRKQMAEFLRGERKEEG